MWFTAIALGVGAVAGLVTGGRLRHLSERGFRWWGLLIAGAGLQVAAELERFERVDLGLVLAGYGCLVAFALANIRTVGMGIGLIGIVLNLAPIAANGAMPVDPAALTSAGLVSSPEDAQRLDLGGKRRVQRDGDRLLVLRDVFPVRALGEVVSFGDLVLAVGIADITANLLRARRQR